MRCHILSHWYACPVNYNKSGKVEKPGRDSKASD